MGMERAPTGTFKPQQCGFWFTSCDHDTLQAVITAVLVYVYLMIIARAILPLIQTDAGFR
jgi:hypothetical protein